MLTRVLTAVGCGLRALLVKLSLLYSTLPHYTLASLTHRTAPRRTAPHHRTRPRRAQHTLMVACEAAPAECVLRLPAPAPSHTPPPPRVVVPHGCVCACLASCALFGAQTHGERRGRLCVDSEGERDKHDAGEKEDGWQRHARTHGEQVGGRPNERNHEDWTAVQMEKTCYFVVVLLLLSEHCRRRLWMSGRHAIRSHASL